MKTNLDQIFKTNPQVEASGVWFEINEKTGFLVKRFGGFNSQNVKAKLAKYHKPYAYQIEKGTLDPGKEQEIMFRVFVESCVLDWKGIEIDGKEAEFTSDACVKLFASLPELAESLISYASDYANYKEELGNS